MSPRGAGTITSRCWFAWAVRRYCFEFSTCSDQRRRKSSAKTVSITAPSTPARSIVCGVRRYGSSTRGSGAMSRERWAGGLPGPLMWRRLAKEPHLCRPLERAATAQGAPAEPEDRERQRDVHEDEARQVEEHPLRVGGLLQEELQRQRRDRHRHGGDRDREVGRMRAVAAGGLAVAAGPVARGRKHERRDAEDRAERRDVDQEPGAKAGERAEDRPAEERHHDDRHEDDVGREEAPRPEEGHLDDDRHEEDQRRLQRVQDVHPRSFGISTVTACSEPKSAYGFTWICFVSSTSFWPNELTFPIGMPAGYTDAMSL